MFEYEPPIDEIATALLHHGDIGGLLARPEFAHIDLELVHETLREFARFARRVIVPLDEVGDRHGVGFEPASSAVTTAPGWREAYNLYVEAGWGAVPFPTELGGGGFPKVVGTAMQEILAASSLSFSLCPMLTQGAIEMLSRFATPDLQARFIPRLISGEWTGTMNLTESQAGSDLSALTTRAVPDDDGRYRITGQKIFITYGEHDLAENIVHLVLARVTRGDAAGAISCFLIPKFLDEPKGVERNGVRCLAVERKLGIHASPTCVLDFDDAVGWLVGAEGGGLRAMFSMMNNARLAVGVQGLAVAEASFQQALEYALERRQGSEPAEVADRIGTIADHPDVRRMLLTMRSLCDAMRGLIYLNARALDEAAGSDVDSAIPQETADLLTPLSKAWCTDMGVEVASLAMQVHGGAGYVEETGIARRLRDARIAPIYEGTNGIQAMDLVGRKLSVRDGAAMLELLERLRRHAAPASLCVSRTRTKLLEHIDAAVASCVRSTRLLAAEPSFAKRQAAAAAYLRQTALTVGATVLVRNALSSSGSDTRTRLARFYCLHLLPQVHALEASVAAGSADVLFGATEALATGHNNER